MRLTCPNCGAQYEVPDDVIPSGGRDVQCSNCGSTWFQDAAETQLTEKGDPVAPQADGKDITASADAQTAPDPFEEVEPPDLRLDDQPDPDETPPSEVSAPAAEQDDDFPEHDDVTDDLADEERDNAGNDWNLEHDPRWDTPEAPEVQFTEDTPDTDAQNQLADADDDQAEHDDTDDGDDEYGEPLPSASTLPRGLDASITDVLRQEADHESRARLAEENQTLETQTEMGLDAPDDEANRHAIQARARMRRLRGQPEETSPTPAPAARDSRRDLLPDIEEVNSTLRKSGETSRTAELLPVVAPNTRRTRGFRLGFAVALLIAVAALLVYSSHAELSQNYPAAAPYIERFVSGANASRVWIDGQVTQLFLWLDRIASGGV